MGQGSHVPGNVVAPTGRLNPVDTTRVDPDKVTRTLEKSIDRDLFFHQLVHAWPPGAAKVVDFVLITHLLQSTPVLVRNSKPLAITGPDVDVYETEIIVFLVGWNTSAGNFHVEFNGVHPDDVMTQVTQHISGMDCPCPRWKFD